MATINGSTNNSNWSFKLEAYETSYSIVNNTSNVRVTAYLGRPYSQSYAGGIFDISMTVNGSTQSASGTVPYPTYINQGEWYSLYTFDFNGIPHNTDGSKTVSVSCSFSTSEFNPSSCSASGSLALTNIPRYTSITGFSVSKVSGYNGLSSLKFNWSTSDTIDYLWYSTDNGNSWTGYDCTDGTSGNFTKTGLSPNTSYNCKIRVRRRDSQLTTDSSVVNQSTYDINRVSSPANNFTFNNGNTLTISGSSPSGSGIKCFLETIINGTVTRRYTVAGSSVTLTASQMNSLMQYMTTSNSSGLRVGVITMDANSNEKYYSYVEGTYSIVNSNPTFSAFAYYDSNTTIVNITGSNQAIVKNKSNLKVKITSSNKMVANNYATPSSYRVSINTKTNTVNYSTNDVEIDMGIVETSGNTEVAVSAIDSRGNITTKTITINVIDYEEPSQVVSLERTNSFENTTKLNVSGIFSLVRYNNSNKNSIQSVRCRYKNYSSYSWNEWQTMTYSQSSNTYTCTQKVFDLDNEQSFIFEVEVSDKIGVTTITYFVSQGVPIMFMSGTNKNIGVGCVNSHEEYSLQLKGNLYLASGNVAIDYTIVREWD